MKRCLACGYVFDAVMEMCPRRYQSPHGEKMFELVAEGLHRRDLIQHYSPKGHREVIAEAKIELAAWEAENGTDIRNGQQAVL